MSRAQGTALLLGCLLLSGTSALARPGERKLLRYQEDHRGSTEPLKDIVLAEELRLSLGGEARARFEGEQNGGLGITGGDTAVLILRALAHADLRWQQRVRVFVQLNSLWDVRSGGATGPLDEDRLDFQQAFLELASDDVHGEGVSLRLGRQEILLGSGRLFAIRKGPNLRRSFDAARLTFTLDVASLALFAGAAVQPSVGVFDDQPSTDRWTWGAYATVRPWSALGLDLYYLGTLEPEVVFSNAIGDELRHSTGARIFGGIDRVDFNFEGVLQAGSIGEARILAWTLASDTGMWHDLPPFRLRTALRANVTSGDHNPNDRIAGTFDALFPNQTYFSDQALLFPSNFYDLHPVVMLEWSCFLLETGWDVFFRQSTRDAVYAPPGRVLLPGGGSGARFIGHQLNMRVATTVSESVELTVSYSRFFAGAFVTESGASGSDFIAAWIEGYY